MRIKGLLWIIFTGLVVSIHGQVIITSNSLPHKKDTLEVLTDLLPSKFNLGLTGNNVYWDFNSLTSPFIYQYILRNPNQGLGRNDFPNSESFTKNSEGYEMYFKWSNQKMYIVGYYGYDFTKLGIKASSYFTKPFYTIRETPLRYGDRKKYNATLIMPVTKKDVPAFILKKLPYTPDSLRFIMEVQRRDHIDASGMIDLHVQQYPVLRVSQKEWRNKKLEVKSQSIPWQDVTELFKGDRFLAPDSTYKILFLSNETRVPVVEFFLNPVTREIQKANYTSHPFLNNIVRIKQVNPDIFAYPNPTLGKLRLDFINLRSGFYTVKVRNLLGRLQWEHKYYIDNNKSIRIDLTHLYKGTYFYSLINEQGETITTKRLVIFNP